MCTIKLLKYSLCFKGLLLTSITYLYFFVEECKTKYRATKPLFTFTLSYLVAHALCFPRPAFSGVRAEPSSAGQLVSTACIVPRRVKQVRRLKSERLAGKRIGHISAQIQRLLECRHFFHQHALVEMVAACPCSQGLVFLLLGQLIVQEAVNVCNPKNLEACPSCPDGGFGTSGTVQAESCI